MGRENCFVIVTHGATNSLEHASRVSPSMNFLRREGKTLGVANSLGAREAKPSESGACTDLHHFFPKRHREDVAQLSLK